jgi:hypothetical protein
MALSDDERRRLEELENLLQSDDPTWAHNLGKGHPGDGGARRLVLAILAILAGLALVVAGAATRLLLVGVAGFALECWAAYWLLKGEGAAGIRAFFLAHPAGGRTH